MLHFWNFLGLSEKLVVAFIKTWIGTSSWHVTNLDVSEWFKFSFASLLLMFKIWLSPTEFWSLKRKASSYWYWQIFPHLVLLSYYPLFNFQQSSTWVQLFLLLLSDCLPVNKIIAVLVYGEKACAAIDVALKDEFTFENGKSLPWFQVK